MVATITIYVNTTVMTIYMTTAMAMTMTGTTAIIMTMVLTKMNDYGYGCNYDKTFQQYNFIACLK